MPSLQTHTRSKTAVYPSLSQAPSLTADEWELILEALGAYRHHSAFRALYNKIKAGLAPT